MSGEQGKYIVFEGGDGVGKSTTMHLVAQGVREAFKTQVYTVEEPESIKDEAGNSLVPIADALRTIVKNKSFEADRQTNVLLFNAARRENWLKGIQPALRDGIWVLGARNWWSTLVYQGAGEGINEDEIRSAVLSATSPQYINPDLAFILDIDEETRTQRIALRDNKSSEDAFESKDSEFHLRVGEGYRSLAREHDIQILSTIPTPEEVAAKALAHIMKNYRK